MSIFRSSKNLTLGQNFTIIELKELIEHSSKFGVSSLKFEGVEITFNGSIPQGYVPVSPESLRAQVRTDQANLKQDIKNLNAAEIENLLIENPAQYEELLASGELADENRGT